MAFFRILFTLSFTSIWGYRRVFPCFGCHTYFSLCVIPLFPRFLWRLSSCWINIFIIVCKHYFSYIVYPLDIIFTLLFIIFNSFILFLLERPNKSVSEGRVPSCLVQLNLFFLQTTCNHQFSNYSLHRYIPIWVSYPFCSYLPSSPLKYHHDVSSW